MFTNFNIIAAKVKYPTRKKTYKGVEVLENLLFPSNIPQMGCNKYRIKIIKQWYLRTTMEIRLLF